MSSTNTMPQTASSLNANQNAAQRLRAIYFKEGTGFLLVKELGNGQYGTAYLVRSLSNGKLYVRKQEDGVNFADSTPGPNEEVTNAKIVLEAHGTTKLRGWLKYQESMPGIGALRPTFTISYWDYCNAGTFETLRVALETTRIAAPERWICLFLISMITTMLDIHKAGLAHCDAHHHNWFLHRSHPQADPEVSLGDFGNSCTYAQEHDRLIQGLGMGPGMAHEKLSLTRSFKIQQDFLDVTRIINVLLNLAQPTPEMTALYADFRTGAFHPAHYDVEARMEGIIERAKEHLATTAIPTEEQELLIQDQTPAEEYLPYERRPLGLKVYGIGEFGEGGELRWEKSSNAEGQPKLFDQGDWSLDLQDRFDAWASCLWHIDLS